MPSSAPPPSVPAGAPQPSVPSVRRPSSFPPSLDLGRTLSGIGPATSAPATTPEEAEQRAVELVRRLAEHEERARVLLSERDAWRRRAAVLEEEATHAAVERDRLGRELAEARASAASFEIAAREQAELRVRLGEEHATTVAALTRRVSELEEQLAGRRALEMRMSELERGARRALELEQALERAQRRVSELEAAATQPAAGPDELTRVKGIGPGFARALRAAGVTRLAQIAAWTEADIAAIAPVLRTQPDRIRREDWMGRARQLLGGG